MTTDMIDAADGTVEHDAKTETTARFDDAAAGARDAGSRPPAGVAGHHPGGVRPPRRGSALRRSVERTLAIARLDAPTLGVLAAALDVEIPRGSDASLADLAVASLEDPGLARSTLSTLVELATVADLEAGVIATGMASERAAFKRLWAVLKTLDPSLPAGAPSRAVQAGLAAARSASALPDARRKALHKVAEVLS